MEAVTGWVTIEGDQLISPERLPDALVAGYRAERLFIDRSIRAAEAMRIHLIGPSHPSVADVRQAFSPIEARLAHVRRQVGFAEFWRRQRMVGGRAVLGDGLDTVAALTPSVPWWETARDEGFVTEAELRRVRLLSSTWSWRPERELPAGDPPSLLPHGPGLGVDDLVMALLEPGGEETAARLARFAVRLERVNPTRGGRTGALAETRLSAPMVAGDPDTRRLAIRMLSSAERRRLFGGGVPASGSPAESEFALPVGSVIVVPDESAPYLRGRGWSISADRRLVAWDWRGEPGVVPVGGAGGPGRDASGAINRSTIPLRGSVPYRGSRWWNLEGSGVLRDETSYEWEDRRDRMRGQAWRVLEAGGTMSPGQWRWLCWTLMGHHAAAHDQPPGLGRWRERERPSTPLGDEIRFAAGPSSMRGDWSDVSGHARRWARLLLPAALRGHRLHHLAESRPGGDQTPYAEAWAEALEDCPSLPGRACSPQQAGAFASFRRAALGHMSFDAFWERVDERKSYEARRRSAYEAGVEAHRDWMRRHAALVEVSAEGDLVPVPWSPDAYPEPFCPPACMDIPAPGGQVGINFSQLADETTGPNGGAPSFLSRESLGKLFHPSAAAAMRHADPSDFDPVSDPPVGAGEALAFDAPGRDAAAFARACALIWGG